MSKKKTSHKKNVYNKKSNTIKNAEEKKKAVPQMTEVKGADEEKSEKKVEIPEVVKVKSEKKKDKGVKEKKNEKLMISKACWIGNICAVIIAVMFMIFEGIQGHFSSVCAVASICFVWASAFYICQYFIAKRPWQVLIGAVLEGSVAILMIILYFIFR